MVYVLLAIALFGVLTATLSSQNNQSDGQDIDEELIEFYANELIEYSAAAKNTIDQMIVTGTTIDQIDFINPTSAVPFSTAPHIHKVFHTHGGGLNYQETFNTNIENDLGTTPGWFFQTGINIEWTNTAANDVVISALRIQEAVCAAINEKITGTTTIPQLTVSLDDIFENGTTNLNTTNCAACEGYPALCVENAAGTNWGYFSILAAR